MPEDLLQNPDGRVNLRPDYSELCRRAMAATQEPALGYEFGFRATLTAHGIVGYGLMSQPCLRQVLDFGCTFGSVLRLAAWDLHFLQEDGVICLRAMAALPIPDDLRECSAQQLIVSAYTILLSLLPECRNDIVLAFDFPQPSYHARYAGRLPTVQFQAPFNEIRLPIKYLDQPLRTADKMSAKLAERECTRELTQLQQLPQADLERNVRALLTIGPNGYLPLAQIASALNVSTRTLIRQLQENNTSYRQLLQEAQHSDSKNLLTGTNLSMSEIASRLGYTSLANFSRACRRWHGMTPGQLRSQALPPANHA